MRAPGRMICWKCGEDLGGSFDAGLDAWVYACDRCEGVDGPLTIEVESEPRGVRGGRSNSGIMAELGLYDSLKEALSREPDRWLEFGVVEHLFSEVDHDAFRTLVEEYGHVALGPDTNTASWILGRALWALQREGEVECKGFPGTGRWSYLKSGNAWALAPPPENQEVLSWAAYAEREGHDLHECPSIDWRPTPNTRGGGSFVADAQEP